jgi:hypothetical protein
MYLAVAYIRKIKKVELVKQTESFFTVIEDSLMQRYKKGKDYSIHNTFEDAVEHLILQQLHKIDRLRSSVDYAEKELEKIRAMVEHD